MAIIKLWPHTDKGNSTVLWHLARDLDKRNQYVLRLRYTIFLNIVLVPVPVQNPNNPSALQWAPLAAEPYQSSPCDLISMCNASVGSLFASGRAHLHSFTFIYIHLHSFTFIYIHLHSFTFIYIYYLLS